MPNQFYFKNLATREVSRTWSGQILFGRLVKPKWNFFTENIHKSVHLGPLAAETECVNSPKS